MNGILYDIMDMRGWKNPIGMFRTINKYVLDLLSGKFNWEEEDSITELLEEKRNWFLERIKKLKGKKSDFEKAVISVSFGKEKVEIIYKGKKFENARVW